MDVEEADCSRQTDPQHSPGQEAGMLLSEGPAGDCLRPSGRTTLRRPREPPSIKDNTWLSFLPVYTHSTKMCSANGNLVRVLRGSWQQTTPLVC